MKKDEINNCVVRIIAENIEINFKIPYQIKTPTKGQGTGFFIDNKGHILTCAHVIQSSKNIYIEIPSIDNKKHKCNVIGLCPEFDIALIKCLDYKSKTYLKLGDSNKLSSEDKVVVIGYPASMTKSSSNKNNLKFTNGIISGQQNGLIQTDSAINPGNSGGPLFCKNKVIGINSQKLVAPSLDNIGYAIPINNYKVIKDQFNKNIIINRPNLLLNYDNTTEEIIKNLTNNKIKNGIIVSKLYEDSPLKNTEIKKDSIITKINNIEIDNYGISKNHKWINTNISINDIISNCKNNQKIKIEYYNNDKKKVSTVDLKPIDLKIKQVFSSFEEVPYFILGGMIFMNLTLNHILSNFQNPKMICLMMDEEFLFKEHVIISYIFPNTEIDILNNLEENDIIKKVNDIEVNNLKELIKALDKCILKNKKEYIRIENNKGKSILMLKSDLIKQNEIFSKTFDYNLSNFHEK